MVCICSYIFVLSNGVSGSAIVRTTMTGGQRTDIISEDIERPELLTIDEDILYWFDAGMYV